MTKKISINPKFSKKNGKLTEVYLNSKEFQMIIEKIKDLEEKIIKFKKKEKSKKFKH